MEKEIMIDSLKALGLSDYLTTRLAECILTENIPVAIHEFFADMQVDDFLDGKGKFFACRKSGGSAESFSNDYIFYGPRGWASVCPITNTVTHAKTYKGGNNFLKTTSLYSDFLVMTYPGIANTADVAWNYGTSNFV